MFILFVFNPSMRLLSFFCCLFLTNAIFAQTPPPSVKNYFHLIRQAENAILDSNIEKALAFYQTAFERLPSPFAVDLRNAAVCAGLLDEPLWVFRFGQRLAKKNANLQLFNNQVFIKFKKTEYWETLQALHTEFSANPPENFTPQYRQDLIQLLEAHRQNRLNDLAPEDYQREENNMYNKLISILKKYGFPTEDKIGLEKGQTDVTFAIYSDIFVYQLQNGHTDLLDTLQKNVWNGNLHPRLAQTIIEAAFWRINETPLQQKIFDKNQKNIYFGNQLFKIQNQYFISEIDLKYQNLIDANRENWLLDPLSNAHLKGLQHPLKAKYFFLGASILTFEFENYSKQENLIKQYELKVFNKQIKNF